MYEIIQNVNKQLIHDANCQRKIIKKPQKLLSPCSWKFCFVIPLVQFRHFYKQETRKKNENINTKFLLDILKTKKECIII